MSGSEPYPDLSDIPCGLDIRLNSSLIINQSNLKHLNKRTLLSRLGRGGYGTVYLAENRAISRVSALKVCNRQLASGSSRSKESKCTSFDAEADAYFYVQTQDLPKVGIPLCYGTGTVAVSKTTRARPKVVVAAEHSYLEMQLLGRSLHRVLEDSQEDGLTGLKPDKLLPLALGMVDALESLHMHGLVHRDIKPDNFCLNADRRAEPLVFITDLGLATKLKLQQGAKGGAYGAEAFMGTPDYASLAALAGRRQGPADDMEALAYALLELATGELPWDVDRFSGARPAWTVDYVECMRSRRIKAWNALVMQNKIPRWCVDWQLHCSALDNITKPDYNYLRTLLRSHMQPARPAGSMRVISATSCAGRVGQAGQAAPLHAAPSSTNNKRRLADMQQAGAHQLHVGPPTHATAGTGHGCEADAGLLASTTHGGDTSSHVDIVTATTVCPGLATGQKQQQQQQSVRGRQLDEEEDESSVALGIKAGGPPPVKVCRRHSPWVRRATPAVLRRGAVQHGSGSESVGDCSSADDEDEQDEHDESDSESEGGEGAACQTGAHYSRPYEAQQLQQQPDRQMDSRSQQLSLPRLPVTFLQPCLPGAKAHAAHPATASATQPEAIAPWQWRWQLDLHGGHGSTSSYASHHAPDPAAFLRPSQNPTEPGAWALHAAVIAGQTPSTVSEGISTAIVWCTDNDSHWSS